MATVPRKFILTNNTSEGLRVTLHSTLQLCKHLPKNCGFAYVKPAKMNQDPVKHFFGKVRQAGFQNDHASVPNFLQLYRLPSALYLLRPPKFGNCEVLWSEPVWVFGFME
ncbi:hypothetical protein HPB47_022244 [Ixodes persulcatus]|uniref:Uncharacterized protein n=1 Tax=Ixodes persulcatus TaxID=34615 RepID=A0AC60QDL9_IXOPE|nr:hypothetical protein HPB47_022244 [Ixodes persulcatus]